MTGEDDALDPALWRVDRPDPTRPAIIAGLRSWAVAAGDGELSWTCETRGAPFDWGGVYAQGIRLTGPWALSLTVEGRELGLAPSLFSASARRSRFESLHHEERFDLSQQLFVPPSLPGICRRLELHSRVDRPLSVTIESAFSPYLAPVLVEGLRPYSVEVDLDRARPRARALGASLRYESSIGTATARAGAEPLGEKRRIGPSDALRFSHPVTLAPRATAAVDLLVWGGVDHFVEEHERQLEASLAELADGPERARTLWAAWTSGTPSLELPDAPWLEEAYALARGALRMLYYEPEPELRGLRAGFPWYATIWGRDLAWMMPAVLWMNDAEWAESSLRSMLRFQAPGRLPMLAAEVGEIPMQLSPGPLLLYGTSDTTLYYPDRIRRLIAHTGGAARLLGEVAPHIPLFRAWIDAKSDPASGLIRNGGEVEGMRDATRGIARVSYGIDSPDTTIWDATDRRDHAVDVQVLGCVAERALAELEAALGRGSAAALATEHAERLARAVVHDYAWPAEKYLVDSVRSDGRRVERLRPNALLAVIEGLLPPEAARAAVDRVAAEDLTADWGVRTLSRRDPGFDPRAYHDGQVWPIATAWAAHAALLAGRSDLALRYLRILADAYRREGGLASECYRGDAPEPWNSCCLLGFSVAPFLTLLFEGLWGLSPDIAHGRLTVNPNFPPGWSSARLDNVVLGDGVLSLAWEPEHLTVVWTGSIPLAVSVAGSARRLAPYSSERFSLPPPPTPDAG